MKEIEVIEYINDWFKKYSNDPNKWNRRPLGICLFNNLNNIGHWKAARRGNPKKAKIASDKAKYENQYGKIIENIE